MNRQRRTMLLGALVAVLAGVLVIGTLVAVARIWTLADQIQENTATTRSVQRTNAATLRRLLDCTTPGGECYSQGQARTGKAVVSISSAAILANACADAPGQQTAAEIRRCVRSLLKLNEGRPPP